MPSEAARRRKEEILVWLWRTEPHGDWTAIGSIGAAWLQDAPWVGLDRTRRVGRRLGPRSPAPTLDEVEAFAVFACTQRRDAARDSIPKAKQVPGVDHETASLSERGYLLWMPASGFGRVSGSVVRN